jgi:hypothetical protein
MGIGIRDRVIQKIIALLKLETDVTKYVDTGDDARIYGAHISTIRDYVLPAVSIHLLPGTGRARAGAFDDILDFQVEPWFGAIGSTGFTWDDVLECHAAIVNALHNVQGTDTTIGIKILEITQTMKGPMLTTPSGLMHIPSRWRVRATV